MSSDRFAPFWDAVKGVDLRRVLEARGYRIRNDGFFEENPIRSENTSSIHIFQGSRWKDFGSSEQAGDLVDFLQAAEGLTLEAARTEAGAIIGVPYPVGGPAGSSTVPSIATKRQVTNEEPQPEEPARDFTNLADRAHTALLEGRTPAAKRACEYLRQRGLDPAGATVKTARVGVLDETVSDVPDHLRGRLLFPYHHAGKVPFFNARMTTTAKDYRKPAGARQATPFMAHTITNDKPIILTEGELDALAILEALGDEAAVLGMGGGGWRNEYVDLIASATEVFILFDRDASGETFTRSAQKALSGLVPNVWTLALPAAAKDANEALTAVGKDKLRASLTDQMEAARRGGDFKYLKLTFLEELDRRHERPWQAYPTGIRKIDHLLAGGTLNGEGAIRGADVSVQGGFGPGLHTIGGITAGGKTSFAVRFAYLNALAGRPIIYVTYEQSKAEIWARIAAHATRADVPYTALKRGSWSPEGSDEKLPVSYQLTRHVAWNDLLRASEHLRVLEGGDVLSGAATAHSLENVHQLASNVKSRSGTPPAIIFDYLQRMPPMPDFRGREIRERVAHVAGVLQVNFARELGCPVIALSSIGRAAYGPKTGRTSHEKRLASLKEAGELEFTSYVVALLYPYRTGDEPSGFKRAASDDFWRAIAFDVVKNREGQIGEIPLYWTMVGDSWSDSDRPRGHGLFS